MKKILVLFLLFLSACAQLHHVQIGELDNNPKYVQKPFDIKISEMGIDLNDVKNISQAVLKDNSNDDVQKALAILSLFQMGPSTGAPVYVKDYAKNLIQVLYEKCPSGKITGLTSVRETRKYPVISGEIVKVTGYCLLPKNG